VIRRSLTSRKILAPKSGNESVDLVSSKLRGLPKEKGGEHEGKSSEGEKKSGVDQQSAKKLGGEGETRRMKISNLL